MRSVAPYALLLTLSLATLTAVAQPGDSAYAPKMIRRLENALPRLMKLADIPGLSAAYIIGDKIVWTHHYGVSDAQTKQPVTDSTIFEAASLSKVVAAYAALKLVDAGKLDLDKPLNQYLGNNYDIGRDERINLITARRVLTHSAGFPNWRSQGADSLPILFNPGEKFSYSGEGFVYLSKVIEHITKQPFKQYVQQVVFKPLGMTQSSFEWEPSYERWGIYRHDWLGNRSFRFEQKGVSAAASLHTTAKDYAKFMIAVQQGAGLRSKTWQAMLTPQIRPDSVQSPNVAWGLGVGLETLPNRKTFWHWGDQGDSKCFMVSNVARQEGLVYFTNSSNGLSITGELLTSVFGGEHPAVAWLDYPVYNPAAGQLLHAILEKGVAVALPAYLTDRTAHPAQAIGEGMINSIGYYLLRLKKTDEAIAVFTQNTVDYPQSGNVWDSLAEAYMTKGDKAHAIEYYEKAVQLDPTNTNAIETIKRLKKE